MAFYDIVDVEYDAGDAGDELPTFETLVQGLPCNILYITGQQGLTGDQIEAELTHKVLASFNAEFGRIRPSMRLRVVEGQDAGMLLNIYQVSHVRKAGLDQGSVFFCKELVNA